MLKTARVRGEKKRTTPKRVSSCPLSPLGEKLQIKENYTILLVNAPAGYESKLGKLPPNVKVTESTAEPIDVVQVFVASKKELETQLKRLNPFVKPKGLLWVTYPKGASKAAVNINRGIIAKFAQTVGSSGRTPIALD